MIYIYFSNKSKCIKITQKTLKKYKFSKLKIILLNSFLGDYKDIDKILKLKSYQYTVEVRKSTKIFMLDIYTKNRTPTTYLSDEQIKRLNEFNDYLNTPEAIECLKRIDRFMRYIILPIIFSLVVLFIFIFFVTSK